MSTTIALYEGPSAQYVALDPDSADALARLGVTKVTFLADSGGIAVVLEGWAFDVHNAAEAAAVAVRGDGDRPRILFPVSETSVHHVDRKGAPT